MFIGSTGTINYAPDAIYQFEREIDGASANIKTPLKISNYDFKSTIPAVARMGESMLSANGARVAIGDNILAYREIAKTMRESVIAADEEIALAEVNKLSN